MRLFSGKFLRHNFDSSLQLWLSLIIQLNQWHHMLEYLKITILNSATQYFRDTTLIWWVPTVMLNQSFIWWIIRCGEKVLLHGTDALIITKCPWITFWVILPAKLIGLSLLLLLLLPQVVVFLCWLLLNWMFEYTIMLGILALLHLCLE